ncbi:putative cysteine proteinase inhibitor 7 [Brachypodium distachyon]|uniref:Cystatin domain-containing protein n=1 Tax=Brachypodium distachyon TaxID=15368 RepID=I1H8B0_BRADI|nr:putative cysteine proteinase inhibitor 7 [Brachypodium distachyon]PNT77932.1 hypothetical protein BRADI_1g70550v3 [Brachypodium distachyon]|eukprot:XP_024313546.1 putative cysteine proteinase inhibitor 7 [Brachypodium distachyon]
MRTSQLLLLLLTASALCAVATPAAAVDGPWQKIKDVADPHVQELGAWAAAAINKVANCGVKFSKVVGGEVQIGADKNYSLDVDAQRPGAKDAVYKTMVYEEDEPPAIRASSSSSTVPGPYCNRVVLIIPFSMF